MPKRDIVIVRGNISRVSQVDSSQEHQPRPPQVEAQAADHDGQDRLQLAVHIFNPISDPHFNVTYHNRKLLPFRHSVECIFARFAWTIFSPAVLGNFLAQCITERRVLVFDPIERRFTVETRKPEQAYAMYKASQSRSGSPKKRAAGEMTGNNEATEAYWESDGLEYPSQPDSACFDEEISPSRGRSKKRQRRETIANSSDVHYYVSEKML